jgi:hypothetical protein
MGVYTLKDFAGLPIRWKGVDRLTRVGLVGRAVTEKWGSGSMLAARLKHKPESYFPRYHDGRYYRALKCTPGFFSFAPLDEAIWFTRYYKLVLLPVIAIDETPSEMFHTISLCAMASLIQNPAIIDAIESNCEPTISAFAGTHEGTVISRALYVPTAAEREMVYSLTPDVFDVYDPVYFL